MQYIPQFAVAHAYHVSRAFERYYLPDLPGSCYLAQLYIKNYLQYVEAQKSRGMLFVTSPAGIKLKYIPVPLTKDTPEYIKMKEIIRKVHKACEVGM